MDFIMDSDLVAECPRRRPEWQWLFIGTRSNHFKVEAPNVLRRPEAYPGLPKYLKRDRCLRASVAPVEWLTAYGSAIKVKNTSHRKPW